MKILSCEFFKMVFESNEIFKQSKTNIVLVDATQRESAARTTHIGQ